MVLLSDGILVYTMVLNDCMAKNFWFK